METAPINGTRFTVLRRDEFNGHHFIDSTVLASSHDAAVQLAHEADSDCGSEYATDCPIVGFVEFEMVISQVHWRGA